MPKSSKSYKTCTTCFEEKLLEGFYINRNSPDGRMTKCKDCNKKASREYKERNKEKIQAYSKKYLKKYYQENREEKLAWQKKYREDNLSARKEYDKKRHKTYYEENKHLYMERASKRRAAKLNAIPPWVDKKHRDRIASIYKACRNVSKRSKKKHHVDHIVPLQGENVCGLHVWWNLRIIPAEMNLSKGNSFEEHTYV